MHTNIFELTYDSDVDGWPIPHLAEVADEITITCGYTPLGMMYQFMDGDFELCIGDENDVVCHTIPLQGPRYLLHTFPLILLQYNKVWIKAIRLDPFSVTGGVKIHCIGGYLVNRDKFISQPRQWRNFIFKDGKISVTESSNETFDLRDLEIKKLNDTINTLEQTVRELKTELECLPDGKYILDEVKKRFETGDYSDVAKVLSK